MTRVGRRLTKRCRRRARCGSGGRAATSVGSGRSWNGKYDFFFPRGTSQKPFFSFLGSPPGEKRWILYEGGHDVPRTQFIREALAWLDKYVGPVR
jgi:hypothetical protein